MNDQRSRLTCSYRLDGDNTVGYAGDGWDDFSRAGGAPLLTAEVVVGRLIRDFLEGEPVRELYGLLFDKIRRVQREIKLSVRCDSAEMRRFMVLSIRPGPEESLAIDGILNRVEKRPLGILSVWDGPVVSRGALLETCGICRRVRVADSGWLELEDAIATHDLLGPGTPPSIAWSVCSACESVVASF